MKTKNLNHFIYSISDLRNLIKDNALFHNYISQETKKFQTSLNPSIAHFLKHKAIKINDQNSIRTYLIIDKSDLEIMGYFCLKIVNIKLEKDVSGKTKKDIDLDKNIQYDLNTNTMDDKGRYVDENGKLINKDYDVFVEQFENEEYEATLIDKETGEIIKFNSIEAKSSALPLVILAAVADTE